MYVSQDLLPKPKRNGDDMEKIMQNAGSFSGLVIDLKKILNIERWNKLGLNCTYYYMDGM